MNSKDYKAIQDVQLRYDGYIQCRRFDLIERQLISAGDNVSYQHSDLPGKVEGKKALHNCFEQFGRRIDENGGFYRTDLSSQGVIRFSEDGQGAKGSWLTIGFRCVRDSEKGPSSYNYYRVYGYRETEFILESGEWKMKNISWKEISALGPVPYDNSEGTGWISLKDRRWELPPNEHTEPWKGGASDDCLH